MTGPTRQTQLSRRGLLVAAAAVLLLAAGSTVAVAAASGAFGARRPYYAARGPACAAPTLPGSTVSVRLVDMRAMMTRAGTMGTPGGMMGGSGSHGGLMRQSDWRFFHHGMMRIMTSETSVPAGVVSLNVTNTGYLTHELVVLPLAAGEHPGSRPVGADGTVDETGGLGEASATCRAGEGDGIAGGSTGWVSMHLPIGRYELVCNLPGHYAAGMYTELDVT